MNYKHLSKADLSIEQEILVEKLSFHSHADRMEPREVTRMKECKMELQQIHAEWDRRARVAKDVHAGLEIVRKRWTK